MATWYVDVSVGTSGDGTSWATAWKQLNNIVNASLTAGDTVLIAGGTYTSTLTAKSGITYERATERGKDGQVIIDGGRGADLPYSGQALGSYTYNTSGVRANGIVLPDPATDITIDGRGLRGIRIRRHNGHGIDPSGSSSSQSNVRLRFLEIDDNGTASNDGSVWRPDGFGYRAYLKNVTVEWCDFHDNGQDCIQTYFAGNNQSFALKNNWFHNTREHPSIPGSNFNSYEHSDGLQLYSPVVTVGSDFHGPGDILDNIFGPGLDQGLIIGDPSFQAATQSLTIRGNLFMRCMYAIFSQIKDARNHQNWTLYRNTFAHAANTQQTGTYIDNSGGTRFHVAHQIGSSPSGMVYTDNLLYKTSNQLPVAGTGSGNVNFSQTTPLTGSLGTFDPRFLTDISGYVNTTPLATWAATDFTPTHRLAYDRGATHRSVAAWEAAARLQAARELRRARRR